MESLKQSSKFILTERGRLMPSLKINQTFFALACISLLTNALYAALPQHCNWSKMFEDHFQSPLDSQKWQGTGPGSKPSAKISSSAGSLSIPTDAGILRTVPITISDGGYFEFKMKVPKNPATVVSIRLRDPYLPDRNVDIARISGSATNEFWYGHSADEAEKTAALSRKYNAKDFGTEFHLVGIEWNSSQLIWFVDDVMIYTDTIDWPAQSASFEVAYSLQGEQISVQPLQIKNMAAYQQGSSVSPFFAVQPKALNGVSTLGSDINLYFEAFGTDDITYQWYKNTEIITGATKNTVSVTLNSLSDTADSYTVKLENHIGEIFSKPIKLSLSAPGSINGIKANKSQKSRSARYHVRSFTPGDRNNSLHPAQSLYLINGRIPVPSKLGYWNPAISAKP